MAVPALQPRPLADWLAYIEPMQPPVNPEVRATALRMFAAGASAGELAIQLERDPALVFLLFRDANRVLWRYDREAHTLEHAVSLLGAERISKLFTDAPALDPEHPRTDAYRALLLRSQHAAAQARLWAEGSGLWPAEEIFWSALLAGAPLWLLCLEAGPAMETLSKRRAEQGAVSRAQIDAALGCDVRALGAALAERWKLPHMAQMSWQRKGAGSPRQWVQLARAARLDEPPAISGRELGELCHHPALVVALANAVAAEADWDWQSRRCLRLLGAAATACRRPQSTIISFVHQTAAKVSRAHAGAGVLTPATKLLCHWNQAHCWVRPAAPPPTASPPAAQADTAPDAALPDERLVAAVVRRLREPARVGNTRAALELAAKALHEGLGLRRVAVFLVRPQDRELQTVVSAGAEKSPALRQFRFVAQNNQLLTQLLTKPVCLLIDAANRDKYWRHLPESLRTAIAGDSCAMMAAFAKGHPRALIYADNAPHAVVSGSRQHVLFRQLCQQLSQCLDQLS